jgi:putative methanogenesis marker protein 8
MEKLKNFLELVKKENGGKLPEDFHVTRKAGALVGISGGQVIKIQEPEVLHCPLFTSLFSHDKINYATIKDKFEKQIKNWEMFTPGRHLCDDRIIVPFGASEMMMYALKRKGIDAAVTVCEGAGTVISANPALIQGIGAYMNGLFYTTPIPEVIRNIEHNGGTVLSPENAAMDQFEGVKKAIEAGHVRVAVTVRGDQQQEIIKIRELEKSLNKKAEIIILAVCNSGINESEAETVAELADLAWSCASKHIRNIAGPMSILQVGMKIPVFVLTLKGIDFISSYSKDKNLQQKFNEGDGKKHYITAAAYSQGAIKMNMGKFSVYLYETKKLPVGTSDEPHPLI